ncbi:MAG: tetratricopeptide repeat protein [Acidobacteriota bacterium]|jgi:predicted O-linked N-acetylglucosamine transferase (SPINDLY family)|nr:tetratricopeptide repeat protein [Acidobacteriota bacterium]
MFAQLSSPAAPEFLSSSFFSLNQALALYEAGELDAARRLCRQIIEQQPANADALNLMGVLACQKKDYDEAKRLLKQAIALERRAAEFYNNLGNAYLGDKDLAPAERCYRKALKLRPDYADALINLGVLFAEKNMPKESEKLYRRALKLEPERADAHNSLGLVLAALNRAEEAVAEYEEALRLKPDFLEARVNLVSAAKALRDVQKVRDVGFKVLEDDPKNVPMLLALGDVYVGKDKYDEASVFYRQALTVAPDTWGAHFGLANTLHQQGRSAEARTYYREALRLAPESMMARLGSCIGQIPLLHRSTNELVQTREKYRKELEALCRDLGPEALADPAMRENAAKMVGSRQPFFLAYQGENDRELQTMYGDLVSRVMAAYLPKYAKRPAMPPVRPGEPLRVGILSGYYYYHSNWKMPIKGWVEHLDREKFQLYGYYTGTREDAQTEAARQCFHRFREKVPTDREWCDTIRRDNLHILLVPEVGMDPMTVRLAAQRLAPVQCTSWGHPDTSGLPTVDYYLSSDLMEPEDGQDNYREKLMRLPNLSIHYEPVEVERVDATRATFGLRDDLPLYICTQSLFKYLPQYDEVFPRIAREAGPCQFTFLNFSRSPTLGKRFLHRLDAAFAKFDLRVGDYVKLLPHLDPPYYRALNRMADVFLDSIGWSGCNSTMEALGCDLPVVTMPGHLMRGRHTHAILKMIGMDETEGRDLDEYVSLAVRMVKDPAWRSEVSGKIARTKHLAYRDMECIKGRGGLEEFLQQAVADFPPTPVPR